MINPARLRQAREYLGLTQAAFADDLEIRQPTIAQMEAGLRQPSQPLLRKIALRTGFPVSFFLNPTPPAAFPLGSLLFRSHASTSQAERARVQSRGELLLEATQRMVEEVEMLPVVLPKLSGDPREAARATRARLRIAPDEPIPSLVHTVERGGVLVLGLPETHQTVDAFSGWVGDDQQLPVIAVMSGKPPDRLRLSVAHEVGHLVLHHSLRTTPGKREEQEAYAFGAELLVPEVAARRDLAPPITLTGLTALKARWHVSIGMLVRLARDLEIITERQYSYLNAQLSVRGWRKVEPDVGIAEERPRAIRQMAELVYGRPIDYRRLANDVRFPPSRVKEFLAMHDGDPRDLDAEAEEPRGKILPLFPDWSPE